MDRNLVTEIQMLFPRIYMACHVEHTKARTSEANISIRDSSILAHLSSKIFQQPKTLAKHLNITASTLSEALHNLVDLGYVKYKVDELDGRKTIFILTEKGVSAMKNTSVLDTEKVEILIDNLSKENQLKAVEGLRLLAEAAVKY